MPEPAAGSGEQEEKAVNDRSPTAPENISVSLRCFDEEGHARKFGNLLAMYVRELSRYFDLSNLDGITVAFDYHQALLDLDRGYPTTHKLTPSEGFVLGVAMTPAVIRDGTLKSHIVFNAAAVLPLEDEKHDAFKLALHMVAHECGHVEVTHRFDAAFPGVLLRSKARNAHDRLRWDIIKACWDEYAVTSICACFGEDPTEGYEKTFIHALNETRATANGLIKAYRLHGNIEQILAEVYGIYGNLMKYACYHLGNIAGHGLELEDRPNTIAALDGHWFKPYFERLSAACKSIADDYGKWTERSKFEVIGDLADEIVQEGGLVISNYTDDGGFHVDIPFSPDTMPDMPECRA